MSHYNMVLINGYREMVVCELVIRGDSIFGRDITVRGEKEGFIYWSVRVESVEGWMGRRFKLLR